MYIRQLIRTLFANRQATFHAAGGEPVPWDTVASEYAAIRGYLLDHVAPGDLVAIHLDYDYRYLLTMLACMEVGVTYVPLRSSWPAGRIEQIRQLSGYRFVFAEDNIDEVCAYRAASQREPGPVTPDTPLYVMYTSGTTGAPKGVIIPRKGYDNLLKWLDAEAICGPDCRILFVIDFTFDMSLTDVALLLLRQCTCFFSQSDGDFFRLAYELEAHEIQSLVTVPNNVNMLLQDSIYERSSFHSLKYLFLGGSRFTYGAYRLIFQKLPHLEALYNVYGPTEATVYCHYKQLRGNEAEEVQSSTVSIGQPIPGLKCLLVDPAGQEVTRPNTPGELLIAGIQLMQGYLGDQQRTAQSLTRIAMETYYRTGDISFRDAAGDYYITGRKDDTLKRRGYRINLLDIDSYLQKLDCVQDSATIAIPDAATDNVLVSFIVPSRQITEDALRRVMADVLVSYQVPDHIVFTDGFPTNNSGKVCKETLKRQFLARSARAA